MGFDDIKTIMGFLRSNYFMQTDEAAAQVWYTHFADYDAGLVREAVMDYMRTERKPPTIADIVDRCDTVRKARRKAPDPNARTVRCPYCRDRGLIMRETPTGVIVGHPCTECSSGRERYPWRFLSPEEQQAYKEREAKAGRPYVEPHECSREFYEMYTGLMA